MADLLTLIYSWFFQWFLEPIRTFITNYAEDMDLATPVVITMPGSNTPLISLSVADLFFFGSTIFLFIGSIICFIGVLKFMYKMGKSLFQGRR